jgi:hypothetical protein
MSTHPELLEQYKPFLKYDSHEAYFADSAAEWTDNPGNTLKRADGTVLATAENGLNLGFLGATYGPNAAAAKTDVISNPSRDYAKQARRFHADAEYANRVYGHVAAEAGDQWLQYWFFYFYNDYNLIGSFLAAGLHEGDWEMIQLRLPGDEPDLAVYAQHKDGSTRDWRQVDRLPGTDRPIVYVARGSHASYFEPGTHWTGHWFDHADGKRRSPELALETVEDTDPSWKWIHWPGHWGDTIAQGSPLDSDSPVGPGAHKQWSKPDSIVVEREETLVPRPELPRPPDVRVERDDDALRVRFQAAQRPAGLVVTVNSPEEPEPPRTETFPVDSESGEVVVSGVDPALTYDVYTSVASEDGFASESVRADVSPISPPGG